MRAFSAALILVFTVSIVEASQEIKMRYTKITGTFLKFDSGQRLDTGVSYASQELRINQHELFVRTYGNGKQLETRFELQEPVYLNFVAKTDDATIPDMTGHFFNSDYEDCILSAELPNQKVSVSGVVTKLDQSHALSTKTVTSTSTGKVVGVLQERIELVSEGEFKAAINQPKL